MRKVNLFLCLVLLPVLVWAGANDFVVPTASGGLEDASINDTNHATNYGTDTSLQVGYTANTSTELETQIILLDVPTTTASTSYTPTTGATGWYRFDLASYDPDPDSIFLEVWMRCSTCSGEGTDSTYAILYDSAAAATISASEVFWDAIGSGHTRLISGNIADQFASAKTITVAIKSTAGNSVGITQARLIVHQTGTIVATRIVVPIGGNDKSTSVGTVGLECPNSPQRYLHTVANWPSSNISAYYEVTGKVWGTSPTATYLLRNITSSVTEATLTTSSLNPIRLRSADIWSGLNDASTLTTNLKTSASDTTYLYIARLIFDLTNTPTKFENHFPCITTAILSIVNNPPAVSSDLGNAFRYVPEHFGGFAVSYYQEVTWWPSLGGTDTGEVVFYTGKFNTDTLKSVTGSLTRSRGLALGGIPTTGQNIYSKIWNSDVTLTDATNVYYSDLVMLFSVPYSRYRSIINFDLPAPAVNAPFQADSVKLKLRGTSEVNTTDQWIYLHVVNITERPSHYCVTWDSFDCDADSDWTTGGGDYTAKVESLNFTTPDTWYTITVIEGDLHDSIQNAITYGRDVALELINKVENAESRKNFSSAEGGMPETLLVYGTWAEGTDQAGKGQLEYRLVGKLDAAYIDSAVPSTNKGNDTLLWAGATNNSNATITRFLLNYHLYDSLPTGCRVYQFSESLYQESTFVGSTNNCRIVPLKRNRGRVVTEGGVTWLKYDGTNNWAGAGQDTLGYPNMGYNNLGASNNTWYWNNITEGGSGTFLKPLLYWLDRICSKLEGEWMLRRLATEKSGTNRRKWVSSDDASSAKRPVITIVFDAPSPEKMTFATMYYNKWGETPVATDKATKFGADGRRKRWGCGPAVGCP